MKKLVTVLALSLLLSTNVNAESITEELTQLNNLFKEGAITKEEFSTAKSIILKTNSKKELVKKKNIKKKKKESSKKVDEKEKKLKAKNIIKKDYNLDLTKSYLHINEINDLGTFETITDVPEGLFKSKSKSFSARAKLATSAMYLIFVQQKNLMEKNPENLMKAMGYFEFFYMEELRKKRKSISTFRETWPNINHNVRKDIKSLYSLNQARKTMRKAMGLTIDDDIQVALKRYMLMHDFLIKAKKETIKLTSNEKKLRKNSKKLNTGLNSLKKNINLKKEKRIDEKEFNKNNKKNIKLIKIALKQLSSIKSDHDQKNNSEFYKTINKIFIKTLVDPTKLDLTSDGINFIIALLKDVEKSIVPKKYFQNMDGIQIKKLSEQDQKSLATISFAMKLQKKESKELLQKSILNLDSNNFQIDNYVNAIKKNDFDVQSVVMTFDNYDNMKKWASADWAKSWKGELPSEIKDNDGNLIKFTDDNIQDLKAQLAINTFNEMINFDQSDLKSAVNDNIKEVAQEVQSSGGFNIKDYLNQDFTITLNNYSQLVGGSLGIDISNFKDLTKVTNDFYKTNMTPEEYARHWESAQYMDSTSTWGDVTLGVDLIEQVGSFDAASIAKNLGADLQTVADSIAQAAAVGVSTDLEAAAQGLGYGSFAEAVAAYNAEHGTSYTTESAKEALGN